MLERSPGLGWMWGWWEGAGRVRRRRRRVPWCVCRDKGAQWPRDVSESGVGTWHKWLLVLGVNVKLGNSV